MRNKSKLFSPRNVASIEKKKRGQKIFATVPLSILGGKWVCKLCINKQVIFFRGALLPAGPTPRCTRPSQRRRTRRHQVTADSAPAPQEASQVCRSVCFGMGGGVISCFGQISWDGQQSAVLPQVRLFFYLQFFYISIPYFSSSHISCEYLLLCFFFFFSTFFAFNDRPHTHLTFDTRSLTCSMVASASSSQFSSYWFYAVALTWNMRWLV